MGAFYPYPASKNRVTSLLTSNNFLNKKWESNLLKEEVLDVWKIVFKSSRLQDVSCQKVRSISSIQEHSRQEKSYLGFRNKI